MFELKTIKHKDMSEDDLIDAIRMKQIAWPYPVEKQKEWIEKNILSEDVHCFLVKNGEYKAYMNLVNESLYIDDTHHSIWGVGNVCSKEKGKGYGNAIMQLVNQYIADSNRVGLLICHDNLIPFYEKNGWITIDINASKSAVCINGGVKYPS